MLTGRDDLERGEHSRRDGEELRAQPTRGQPCLYRRHRGPEPLGNSEGQSRQHELPELRACAATAPRCDARHRDVFTLGVETLPGEGRRVQVVVLTCHSEGHQGDAVATAEGCGRDAQPPVEALHDHAAEHQQREGRDKLDRLQDVDRGCGTPPLL